MLGILEEAFEQLHKQGGRPPKLTVLDRLIIALGYYREHRTMAHIAFDYGVLKSRISDAVKWVEDTLLQDGTFSLPGKRELANPNADMELFRQSGIHIFRFILLVGDKGYQGINELHENSLTPYKKPKGGKLTKEQKDFNRSLSRFRIFIEHINRRIKRFKMFGGRYRNKQRKHHKRISLICGIHNFELA